LVSYLQNKTNILLLPVSRPLKYKVTVVLGQNGSGQNGTKLRMESSNPVPTHIMIFFINPAST